ncbi:MAG: hypothetical protein M3377_04195 [Actinomycetota bacterium]|nr:hypothetical protein [Actinomycetota bacterium]
MSPAVLITGGIGAGKTSLAVELGELLAERRLLAAVIDLDWLGWVCGAPAGFSFEELIGRNLEAVWPNFEAAGATHFVLTRAVLGPSELDALRAAVPSDGLATVRVGASAELVEERLRRRDTGAELEHHLSEARTSADTVASLGAEDFHVRNDARPIREVAAEVLERLGWHE